MSVRGREPPALSLTYDLETRTRGDALSAAGVNVNVTLLFAVERYEQVMEAYVRGLERRSATGGPYVEQLIAPDVINTMPEATLRAFAGHGVVGPALGVDAGCGRRPSSPYRRSRARRRARFCDSYDELLACIDAKLATIEALSYGTNAAASP